ncbi:serine/threonine-protein kinase/endoribonuclease ire-1-like isoform X6 [Ctenopharyngodon idella]|uniref:serine/threonine-protein kinase/endoribonuclease ire-1-like isoform X6 n=1 Tax=Ctenopharyngodon idella TaxID=7959 RepID=UPI00222FC615|nr:serine/threonine-protein kinase/endoribonuclease ire-1-like isoform X6 [Ctenopharyngodon idella]
MQKHYKCKLSNKRLRRKKIRWNKSSKRHSTKVEELSKKSDLEKVGNLYFYKDEKYVIGSGGSGTVYIGLSEDGTEVAIKRIIKNPKNNKDFDNELKCLQDLKLESKYIVRYVTFVVDEDFYYLANQLCEYDLEDYMKELRQQERNDKENILRKIVKEMLLGLQVLHRAGVIHRDIKPRNVLIDSGKNARLADFGLSRKLEEGRSTVHTVRAGTQGWEATEILNQTEKGHYKKSSDIQVAGMLVYYILSDGKHPFGDMDREGNIKIGKYTLEHVQDIVAKDLIEWMINKEPAERLTIDEVLRHPYFWDDSSKDAVLRKLGDRPEIQNYETLSKLRNLYIEKEHTEETDPIATLTIYEAFNQLKIENEKKRNDILAIVGEDLKNLWKLFNTAKDVTEGKSFSNWKSKLSEIWTDINKKLPEDILGLLRVLRNKLVHANVRNEFEERNIFGLFPDFFISLHRVAKDLNWNY